MDAVDRARRERHVRRIIDQGLRGCPPMEPDEVRELAHDAGIDFNVPRPRVDEIFDQARRAMPKTWRRD